MPDPANYTWELIDKLVRRSMDRVIDHDMRLLVLGPSEHAVMHRLSVYIKQDFPGWHVDCEYNRQGDAGDRKQAGGVENGTGPMVTAPRPEFHPRRRRWTKWPSP